MRSEEQVLGLAEDLHRVLAKVFLAMGLRHTSGGVPSAGSLSQLAVMIDNLSSADRELIKQAVPSLAALVNL